MLNFFLSIYIVYANHTPGLSVDKTHKQENYHKRFFTGPIGQSVASPTADPVIGSQILARSLREHSGSVVECLTRDRRVACSSLTGVTALWSLSKTHLS